MRRRLKLGTAILVTVLAIAAPATAQAATVVNGDFETGNLSGWQQYNSNPAGEWFTYDTEEAEGFLFPPPFGNWAAADDQGSAVLTVLYQDVALEPFFTHQLAMTLYYLSSEPIVVPSPNELTIGAAENQQLRVDVMKPTAPIDSVSPSDILATVFANKNGDPEVMEPTRFTADLSAFAGQTVRLRIANAVRQGPFTAGVDGVSITSTPLPPESNAISRGKLTLNKKKGTGTLAINVPGPGTLNLVAKGKPKPIKAVTLTTTAAGTVKLPLKPSGAGLKVLKKKGKLKAQVNITFTPARGTAATQTYKVTLKKTLKPKDR